MISFETLSGRVVWLNPEMVHRLEVNDDGTTTIIAHNPNQHEPALSYVTKRRATDIANDWLWRRFPPTITASTRPTNLP